MVRKQLYLRDDQEQALKERARSSGTSEAELVRHAVDILIASDSGVVDADLHDLLDAADHIAGEHRLPAGWSFDRDDLHERE